MASIDATVFFPSKFVFLEMETGEKNVYQEKWQKHKERTPTIDRKAKGVRIHDGENKRTRDREGEGKREHDREESR